MRAFLSDMRMFPPKRERAARTALASLAVCAVVAVPALAAPERTGVITASAVTYTWDGGPGNGVGQSGSPVGMGAVRCQPVVYECEDTLIDLKQGGTLTVEIKAGSGSNDLDVRLFRTDAAGEVPADQNGFVEDISENKDAKVTARNLKPGYYLVRVAFYNATQGTYTGTATLSGFATEPPPAVAPTTPVATPTPPPSASNDAAAKEKKRKAALAKCNKKAKKIKNAKKRKKAQKACAKKYRKKRQ